MTSLERSAAEYLRVRRALGFELVNTELLLRSFLAFMRARCETVLTTRLAVEWTKLTKSANPGHWNSRLIIVRGFARFLAAHDPRHEVPPDRLLRHRRRRVMPHVFTDAEIKSLISAARDLPSPGGLRGATMSTLIGLLAVTGIRHGEALRLEREDVDLTNGVLSIRETKFNKNRLVPLHRTAADALVRYGRHRDRRTSLRSTRFFIKEDGTPYTLNGTRAMFVRLCRSLGIRPRSKRPNPRMHDLRHTFAIRTVESWYRAGKNVDVEIAKLATYLGHGSPSDTYWYLSAVPELMRLAERRALELGVRGAS